MAQTRAEKELYATLKVSKVKIVELEKQVQDKEREIIKHLDSKVKDLEKIKKLNQEKKDLLEQKRKWIEKYRELQKRRDSGKILEGYIQLGGSHSHIGTKGGLQINIYKGFSLYGEGGYRFHFRDTGHDFFYEAGIKYTFD